MISVAITATIKPLMLRPPLSPTIAAIESFLEPRERPGVMLRPCDLVELVIAAPTAAEGFVW